MDSCDECGFVYADLPTDGIATGLRRLAGPYRDALLGATDPEALRRRPDPATWSALEYAGHTRDVLLAQRDRTVHALVTDRPGFFPIHREARVALVADGERDATTVADELAVAAELVARLYERLDAPQLARRCIYNFPTKTEVDVAWVGRHTVHEGEHHLGDVRRVLALATGI